MSEVSLLAQRARAAAKSLKLSSGETRRAWLCALAHALEETSSQILAANALDHALAVSSGLAPHWLDRLLLNEKRLASLAESVAKLAELPDPLANRFDQQLLANGLRVVKQRVPLGVLGVIFESRPNVAIDTAALSIYSGNAVVLRGGKEAARSVNALVACIRQSLVASGLPPDSAVLLETQDRMQVLELLKLNDLIDLIIPRGGAGLHDFCRQHSSIPVITGGIGICHLYVDQRADVQRSIDVILNAKVQRPTVCNALDTVLVHQAIAAEFVPALVRQLRERSVEIVADELALSLLEPGPGIRAAQADDYAREWLSLTLSMAVVPDAEHAMQHIERYSSGHSDGILSDDHALCEAFLQRIDSAAVYANASTRFTDGEQLGLGAEVAISTQKIHARGPMALRELTSYKWVIQGDYHVRPD